MQMSCEGGEAPLPASQRDHVKNSHYSRNSWPVVRDPMPEGNYGKNKLHSFYEEKKKRLLEMQKQNREKKICIALGDGRCPALSLEAAEARGESSVKKKPIQVTTGAR